jgi:predicted transposase YdaD
MVKRELILLLEEIGYSPEATSSLLRFLDWLIRLPEELDRKLEREIDEIREVKHMPYISRWERRIEERGKKEGKKAGVRESLLDTIIRQLKRKIGKLDDDLKRRLEQLSVARLKILAEDLLDFSQPDDLDRWLKRKIG